MKRFDWQDGGDACEHSDGDWVRYDDARAVIDGLQALLNERDAEIDRLAASLTEWQAAAREREALLVKLESLKPAFDLVFEAYNAPGDRFADDASWVTWVRAKLCKALPILRAIRK